MPWSDPQFWIVSLAFVGGVVRLLKTFAPGDRSSGPCSGCATGAAACSPRHRGASRLVTLGGRSPRAVDGTTTGGTGS